MHVAEILPGIQAVVPQAIKVQINTLDANWIIYDTQEGRRLVRAPDGTLWTAYINDFGIALRDILVAYSTDGGLTWTEEVAVTGYRPVYSENCLNLVVDSNSVPHIIFYMDETVGNDTVRYANRSGGTWGTPEVIYTDINVASITACIDGDDTIHIAFDRTNIIYITGTAGSWATETALVASNSWPTIAVDSSGYPYIVYIASGGGIFMIERTGGSWSSPETIEDTYTYAKYPSIAIDSNDDLHVAWRDIDWWVLGYILYRKRESGVWQTIIEVASNDVITNYTHPCLSIDTSDDVYVVYCYDVDPADNTIYYRKITAGVLGAIQTIDATLTRPGNRPSLGCSLFHKYPSSGILPANLQPAIIALDENAEEVAADIYFEGYI